MEEIHHCKFSLFRTEHLIGEFMYDLKGEGKENIEKIYRDCFEHIKTFDNLEEAKIAQKEFKQKTIILPSY